MIRIKTFVTFLLVTGLAACDQPSSADTPLPVAENANASTVAKAAELEDTLADIEAQSNIKLLNKPWTGDLDVMTKKRMIRVLTVYGLGRYYLDNGQERGMTYEWFKMFEEFVNDRLGNGHLKVHVLFIPVARDQLIPGLVNGRGDIAAAGLTITPERAKLIDFTNPATDEVSEVLVTGPSAPRIETLEDLAGREVYVRASSSYRSSLDAVNAGFREKGLEEIRIRDALEQLEDEDILEMVNSGMLEWAIVDDYKAKNWTGVFVNLTVRGDLVFRSGGRIGFAMRKDSPQLAAALNEFLKTHKQGTLKGNILINRYLKNVEWSKNALAQDDYARFREVADIFSNYGEKYGVDYLLAAAQGYQESRLDQDTVSHVGAVGIMQLLPSTAADPNVGIPDITTAEPNIHAGIKYLDFIRSRYFADLEADRFNQTLLALASYNAGPARVQKMRTKAAEQGYDPNVWFGNVEVIASRDIGAETVQYVANIVKYYMAYRLATGKNLEREAARKSAGIE